MIGPTNLIAEPAGTSHLDSVWLPGAGLYYKLAGVDEHGNIGECAILGPADITVGTLLQSWAAEYAGDCIEVSWSLSEPVDAGALAVFRAAGESGTFEELASAIRADGLGFMCRDADIEPGSAYRYRVELHASDGPSSAILFETGIVSTPAMPITLHQNHPNPFNPSTAIRFYLPRESEVSLEVYDPAGRLVARLADGRRYERGIHELEWNGSDGTGRAVSSGVYFYRLNADRTTLTKKMILIR